MKSGMMDKWTQAAFDFLKLQLDGSEDAKIQPLMKKDEKNTFNLYEKF